MEKRVYVKRYPREDGRREECCHDRERRHDHRRDDFRGDRHRSKRHEKHVHREFFDGKPPRPPRPGRPFEEEKYFRRMRKHMTKQITKMFTDKAEMVAYVNDEGERGHNIDVYKIEDDLYKVVVTKKPNFEKLFAEEAEKAEEVEIEVEIEEE